MTIAMEHERWTAAGIRRFREERKLTQEEMAQLVGVAVSQISRWENGHHKPTRLACEKLNLLAGGGDAHGG